VFAAARTHQALESIDRLHIGGSFSGEPPGQA